MRNFLLVVEGAHDAAFFGRLAVSRGFHELRTKGDVPEFWTRFIPSQYPSRPDGRLDRVICFPDFYGRGRDTLAISVAGGDSRLVETLRDAVDLSMLSDFVGLALALDTDHASSEEERFESISGELAAWNNEASSNGEPGFPVKLPTDVGEFREGPPRFGIYLFPGQDLHGALETVLLNCADVTYPSLPDKVSQFMADVIGAYPGRADLKRLEQPGTLAKGKCGVIANLLRPGSSLAVALREADWLPDPEDLVSQVSRAAKFLDSLLM